MLKPSMFSGGSFIKCGYQEIIIPNVWGCNTFIEKAGGSEILQQMFTFSDKNNRNLCLNPEITGILQELINQNYFQNKYPAKIFYVSRCYRYEKPQRGRYREFTQLGVEILRPPGAAIELRQKDRQEVVELLKNILDLKGTIYEWKGSVKRGLSYYVEEGFEVECANLGAQKQIAGGGGYKEGVGFAIGLERWLLALQAPGWLME